MATEECNVCYETFNKCTRKKIACEHTGACMFEACKACIRKYVLNTTDDPSCMNCNRAWSDKFLYSQLTAAFMRGEYKSHRKELLVQQQISRLPETMLEVERMKKIVKIQPTYRVLFGELQVANRNHREIQRKMERRLKPVSIDFQRKHDDELRIAAEKVELCHVNIAINQHEIAMIRNGGEVGSSSSDEAKKTPKIVMPCGNTDCRGYLTSNSKCELCEHHTCGKCLEHIGLIKEEGAGAEEAGAASPHVCKPDNIESAEFVRKQSKPCPCCSARISKIDGCDQMWCTQCHKAFSWNTGLLVSGPIHNPHFYQYQRENGGAVRNPGDVVCGGMPGIGAITDKIRQAALEIMKTPLVDTVMKIHQFRSHFANTYVLEMRSEIDVQALNRHYESARIKYITGHINREQLAEIVDGKDYKRKKATAIINVCELFSTVCADIFQLIIASEKTDDEFAGELVQRISECDTLRLYVNDQLKELSITYGICVQQISAEWKNNSSKFKTNGETAKYIIDRDNKLSKEQKRIEDLRKLYFEERRIKIEREVAAAATRSAGAAGAGPARA